MSQIKVIPKSPKHIKIKNLSSITPQIEIDPTIPAKTAPPLIEILQTEDLAPNNPKPGAVRPTLITRLKAKRELEDTRPTPPREPLPPTLDRPLPQPVPIGPRGQATGAEARRGAGLQGMPGGQAAGAGQQDSERGRAKGEG